MIPEWQINGNAIQMNLWDANTGNHFFSGYNLKTNYTPNTWVCYEIMIDIVNKKAQFWVNGVSKGSFTNSGWSSNWYIRNIEIGGNQYGHPWQKPVEQYIDYDDIVVSTSYIGPDAGTPVTSTECVNDATGLQAALTIAQSNGADDTIEVVQGKYNGNFTYSSDDGNSITLLGGFSSGCISRVVDPANTILDGGGSGLVLGLYNTSGGDIALEGFTIRNGNNGNGVGGVDTLTIDNITLTTNIITGNTSSGAPGGVFAESGSEDSVTAGDVTLTNNIIAANTAKSGQGGGVAAWSHSTGTAGTVTLTNNTIVKNNADSSGGVDLYAVGSSGGTVNCYNNIIWGNTAATSGGDIYLNGAGVAKGYNNDYTSMAGSSWTNEGSNINIDPLFDAGGNYHLSPDSPCIDRGSNSAPDIPAADIDGDDRVIDGDKSGTATVDIGADEYNGLIVAESPPDGAIFEGWALINKYQPSFQWIAVESFKSFVILFSTSGTDFSTKGVLITKGSISGTKSSWTPPIATWRKIMTSSYNSGSIREIYWKIVGTKADKSSVETPVRYLSIADPIPPVIQSPGEGDSLPSGTPPTFIFDTSYNVKCRLEISTSNSFDPHQTKAYTYKVTNPNITTTLQKTLSVGQWTAVKKLIGTGTGYFRIRGWDAIKRETSSEARSFSIQY